MDSPAADDELAAAPLVEFRQGLVFIALGLVVLAIGLLTRPPRWLLVDAGDHVVNGNGNGNGHGVELDADALARAET